MVGSSRGSSGRPSFALPSMAIAWVLRVDPIAMQVAGMKQNRQARQSVQSCHDRQNAFAHQGDATIRGRQTPARYIRNLQHVTKNSLAVTKLAGTELAFAGARGAVK